MAPSVHSMSSFPYELDDALMDVDTAFLSGAAPSAAASGALVRSNGYLARLMSCLRVPRSEVVRHLDRLRPVHLVRTLLVKQEAAVHSLRAQVLMFGHADLCFVVGGEEQHAWLCV